MSNGNRSSYVLAIDQGTSCTKALLLDGAGSVMAKASVAVQVSYANNLVEQSPMELYRSVVSAVGRCMDEAMQTGISKSTVKAIGITNQRETFVLWGADGLPLYPAISWQCKRSSAICDKLMAEGYAALIKQKSGLVVDPYFSATKVQWLVEEVPSIRASLAEGSIHFGTIDTWLLYCLTNGRHYQTDHTNASRTMLFNIHTLDWDRELIALFGLGNLRMPAICPSAYQYGETDVDGIFDRPVPVSAMIGDSQAASVGAGCIDKGQAKATLGTGCSVMMTVGNQLVAKSVDTVDAICYSTPDTVVYAAEGIIISCGATVEWLKNQLGLIARVADVEAIARRAPADHGVYLLPAFSGLGAPYWRKSAKAAIMNLSFAADKSYMVRAALESVGFQIYDVVQAMEREHCVELAHLTVNGGMAANGFVLQFLSNLLNKPIRTSPVTDASALGCAYLAAMRSEMGSITLEACSARSSQEVLPDEARQQVAEAYQGWSSWLRKIL